MKKVVLESPYRGKSKFLLLRWIQTKCNVRYARKCIRNSLLREEAPIASHLLYTQPYVLDDAKASERRLGINAGFIWNKEAEMIVVYVDKGVSSGMEEGIELAEKENIPVEYRTLK